MAKLIYATISSLDGYIADAAGNFEWARPDEEVHAFVNDLERPIGTHLYGRRMYKIMVAWETMDLDGEPAVVRDYAEIWRRANKIVYSKTLDKPSSVRTKIQRDFDPAAIQQMKTTSPTDISIGGPHVAALAIKAGLIDEFHVILAPVVIGGGTAAFPDGARVDITLIDENRFRGGFVHLHYRTNT